MRFPSFCPLPLPYSLGKKKEVVQGDSGIGVCFVAVTRSLFFLPELPISARRASGRKEKAAVGSWLNRVQVKQAREWMDGGAVGVSQV